MSSAHWFIVASIWGAAGIAAGGNWMCYFFQSLAAVAYGVQLWRGK